MEILKPGDVVQLLSSPHLMVVEQTMEGTSNVTVLWIDAEGHLQRVSLAAETLKVAKAGEKHKVKKAR